MVPTTAKAAAAKTKMSATGDSLSCEADGFTLLETLVVIAVLAAVSFILFPRVERAVDNVQFASARGAVQAAAQAARAEAVRTDSPVLLQASNDGKSLLNGARTVAVLPSTVRVQSTEGGPRFFGDGSAAGGTVEVISPRRRAQLLIADGTGVARWQQ